MKEIQETASAVNQLASRLDEAVRNLEQRLASYHCGVEAEVRGCAGSLHYAKGGGHKPTWRVLVGRSQGAPLPWSESSRRDKLKVAYLLPFLLRKILEELRAELKRAEEARGVVEIIGQTIHELVQRFGPGKREE